MLKETDNKKIILAQNSDDSSTGGTTTEPGAGTTEIPPSDPVLPSEPAPTPTGASTPRPINVISSPKPTSISIGEAEIISVQYIPETTDGNFLLPIALGVLALGGITFFALRAKKNKDDDPCSKIKRQLDVKSRELNEVTEKFSLQESLVQELEEEIKNKKEEVEKYFAEEVKNKTLDTLGNKDLDKAVSSIEQGREIYDDLEKKYKIAKDLLEILRGTKDKRNGELEEFESAYKKCMVQTASSGLHSKGGLKLELPDKKDTPKTTLIFLYKPEEKKILLAMKKRRFGEGKWNGVGGKLNEGETILQALEREVKEEIAVTVKSGDMIQVATIDFSFKDNSEWNQQVHVFLTEKWEGEPVETEEMNPEWYSFDSLPYDKMWIDDIHWLPLVLEGKKIKANFKFNKSGDKILDMKVTPK